jgi:hypothetical protein
MIRSTLQIPPAGGLSQRDIATRLAIADRWTLQEHTPASASDASTPEIRLAYDANYIYVQVEVGIWKRAALSAW